MCNKEDVRLFRRRGLYAIILLLSPTFVFQVYASDVNMDLKSNDIQEEKEGLLIYSESPTRRMAMIVKNGTCIIFKNLIIINMYNYPIKYTLWLSGTLEGHSITRINYTEKITTVRFKFYNGSRTYLEGIFRFTARDIDQSDYEPDLIGYVVDNIGFYLARLALAGLLALVPGGLLGIYAKKQYTKEVKEL